MWRVFRVFQLPAAALYRAPFVDTPRRQWPQGVTRKTAFGRSNSRVVRLNVAISTYGRSDRYLTDCRVNFDSPLFQSCVRAMVNAAISRNHPPRYLATTPKRNPTMTVNTLTAAADLAALTRAIQRAAADLLGGAVDLTDRAAVLAVVQDLSCLAGVAAGRADALAELLTEHV